MGEADWKRCPYRRVQNDNSRHQRAWLSSLDKSGKDKSHGVEPKRHIVLARKRKIVGVDDVTDEEEYNKIEDMTPFAVEVDTSIL